MAELIDNYKPGFVDGAFAKRGDAVDFALYLAGELGLNPKGVTVEKDGKRYHVYIPLGFTYWQPGDDWKSEFERIKKAVKNW